VANENNKSRDSSTPNDPFGTRLGQIKRSLQEPTKEETTKIDSHSEMLDDIDSLLTIRTQNAAVGVIDKETSGAIQSQQRQIRRLEKQIQRDREARLKRATNATTSLIKGTFASASGRITSMAKSPEVVGGLVNGGSSLDYTQLAEQDKREQELRSKLQTKMLETTSNLHSIDPVFGEGFVDENAEKRLNMLRRVQFRSEERSARAQGGMRLLRDLGKDPISAQRSDFEYLGRAEKALAIQKAEGDVANRVGLGAKSGNELKKEQMQAFSDLKAAMDALGKEINGATEEEKKTNKANLEAKKTDAQKRIDDIDIIKGAGGGKGGGAWGKAAAWIQAVGSVAGAAAQGFQQIGVNQELAQKYNISGRANIENQKYAMYQAARSGDVASQMALAQWTSAEQFGTKLKGNANMAVVAQGVSNAADVVLKAVEGAVVGGAMGGGAGAVVGAIGNSAGAVVNTAANITDLLNQVSGGQAQNAGTLAQMDAVRSLIANYGKQVQGYRNYSTGLGEAARGMGSKGGTFLNNVNSDKMLDTLIQEGISPEQMAQMSIQGQAAMGSQFDKSGANIILARRLERSGYGNIQENMQRQTTLAAAGSNNPITGLESVLEASFGKALEDAKTLNMLVENTGAMVSKGTGRLTGLDTTAATATTLAANIDMNDPNRGFAVQRARSATERINDVVTDESLGFVNFASLNRIGKTTGLGGRGQIMAHMLDVQHLQTIKGMGSFEEMDRALLKQGVNIDKTKFAPLSTDSSEIKLAKAKALIDRSLSNDIETILDKGGIAAGGQFRGSILQKVQQAVASNKPIKWDFKSKEGRAEYEEFSAIGKMVDKNFDGETFERSLLSIKATNKKDEFGEIKDKIKGVAGSSELKQSDKLLTDGFTQLAEQAKFAATELGGVVAAMQTLVKLQESVKESVGGDAEKKFSESMKGGVVVFNDAANKWNGIADKLISAGIGGGWDMSTNKTSNNKYVKGTSKL